jgi:aspartyl protease family protein
MGRVIFALLAVGLALGLAVLFGGSDVTDRLGEDGVVARMLAALGVLVLISGGMFSGLTANAGQAFRYLVIWAGIVVALYATYQLLIAPRTASASATPPEISLNAAAMNQPVDPNYPIGKAAALRKADDGHYWAEAEINNTRVRLMVDTGASIVALTKLDAQRMGLKPDTLKYDMRISTAGGERKGAAVTLPSIQIGRVTVTDVEAVVMDEDLEQSLLGMSFLSRLSRWEVSPQSIIIRQ